MDFSFLKRHLTSNFEAPDVDLSGKTVIVTGATIGGLGYETALHFARRNASKLILAMRNEEKAQVSIDKIRAALPDYKGSLEFYMLDMGSFASVRQFCDKVDKLERLDIFVANAGVAHFAWKVGGEGYENTLQVNVIATGLLALRALPVLTRTADIPGNNFKPHFLVVASEVHAWAKLAQQDQPNIIAALNDEKLATPQDTYNISKLLDVFMARELAQLSAAKKVVVNSANPGLCVSELRNDLPKPVAMLFNWIAWSTEFGSRSFVYASTQETSPGAYVSDAKETPPAPFVTSEKGQKVQKQIWGELREIWTKIDPKVEGILA